MDDLLILQWTIIGSAIALGLLLTGVIGILLWGIKAALNGLRTELKADIADTRTGLRAELKADIVELKSELKADIAETRTELKADIASLSRDVIDNRRMIARFALHRHGDDGLPIAPLTDSLDPPEGTAGNSNGNDD